MGARPSSPVAAAYRACRRHRPGIPACQSPAPYRSISSTYVRTIALTRRFHASPFARHVAIAHVTRRKRCTRGRANESRAGCEQCGEIYRAREEAGELSGAINRARPRAPSGCTATIPFRATSFALVLFLFYSEIVLSSPRVSKKRDMARLAIRSDFRRANAGKVLSGNRARLKCVFPFT